MRKKLILILSVLLVLGSFSTSYAAEKEDSKTTDNTVTIEQAKALAYDNSRSLKKYEVAADKAKYQQQQADYNFNQTIDEYNSLGRSLESNEDNADNILDKMESQYEKIESSSDNIDDAENSYDDAQKAKENYRKQLDYLVEELYTTILNQEESLLSLNKEYEIKQYSLTMERKKLQLGSSSQAAVDQLAADATQLNKSIIEQTSQIKINKGQLNDMMGRGYDDELQLTPIEVSTTVEIPDYQKLLSSATQSYATLSQLKRDLNDLEDDQDDEDDYYQYLIMGQEIKEKEISLEDEKINISEKINNLIADVKSKQQAYQLATTNYITAQRTYNWDKKRFELGQISKMALMQSELTYLNAKDTKISSGYSLYLAQHSLKLAESGIFS